MSGMHRTHHNVVVLEAIVGDMGLWALREKRAQLSPYCSVLLCPLWFWRPGLGSTRASLASMAGSVQNSLSGPPTDALREGERWQSRASDRQPHNAEVRRLYPGGFADSTKLEYLDSLPLLPFSFVA